MNKFSLLLTLCNLLYASCAWSQPLDQYQILNHLDNYGNLYLRNKPYTTLPENLTLKGNLNIAKTSIKSLPKGLNVQGSLEASNSLLENIPKGTTIRGYANLLGSIV